MQCASPDSYRRIYIVRLASACQRIGLHCLGKVTGRFGDGMKGRRLLVSTVGCPITEGLSGPVTVSKLALFPLSSAVPPLTSNTHIFRHS